VCESCGAVLATDESHAAPCNIEGHYTCIAEYAKDDHEQCTYCSEYLCTLNPSCTSAPHIDFIAGNAAIGYLLRADLSSIPLV
ncbi:MAG: hypothetical protein IKK75_14870, partial [Clostridia bacterium]|nr:hypothetical protein [Clostridia bacterium]